MSMKIEVSVSLGLVGCKVKQVIEIEETHTEEEVENIAREIMFSMIEWNWKEIE